MALISIIDNSLVVYVLRSITFHMLNFLILFEVRTRQRPNAKLVEGWLGLLAQIIESYPILCKPLWQVWLQFFFFFFVISYYYEKN